MPIKYSQQSKDRLALCHPDLIRVMNTAADISGTMGLPLIDWTVLETLRTVATQEKYVASGASRTMKSRHLAGKVQGKGFGKSHAVDIAPLIDGKVSWAWPIYNQLAKIIKKAASIEGVPIAWGGDWKSFKDGPHWELPWNQYP